MWGLLEAGLQTSPESLFLHSETSVKNPTPDQGLKMAAACKDLTKSHTHALLKVSVTRHFTLSAYIDFTLQSAKQPESKQTRISP